MLSKCHNLLLILWAGIALGSVALADQTGTAADPARPAMLGAAQARSGNNGLHVGQTVNGGRLHHVTRPGLYGMSQPPAGSAYGIVDNRLIRFDPASGRVLSIIRQVDQILD